MISLAFSFAVTALVGSALGEENKQKAILYLRVTSMIAIVIAVMLSAVMLIFRWQISGMYTVNEEVIEISARTFVIAGSAFLLDGLVSLLRGIFAAMGLKKYAAWIFLFALWIIAFPLSAMWVLGFNKGISYVWGMKVLGVGVCLIGNVALVARTNVNKLIQEIQERIDATGVN